MKIILVDAVYCLVSDTGEIFSQMQELLDSYPNRKIILTGADDEGFKKYGLDKVTYEVFTLKHNPEKIDPEYYKIMLRHFNLSAEDVIYFEHGIEAAKSAQSIGIKTFYYDNNKKDLEKLKEFISNSLAE